MAVEPIRFLTTCAARSGAAKDLRAVLEGLIQELRLEEECMDAALWQDGAQHGAYVLVEHWASREAREQFNEAMREAGVLDGLNAFLSAPATTRHYLQLT